MKSISIKWKIYFFLLGFCALLLLILWLSQVVFLDQFYRFVKIGEIKSSAASVEKSLDSTNLEELVERIAIDNDVCIEILSENGNALYSSGTLRDSVILTMLPFEKVRLLASAQEHGGELMVYYNRESLRESLFPNAESTRRIPSIDIGRQSSLIYAKIMADGDGNTVAVLINSVIAPVDATVNTLRIQLYYITGFMLVFSIILAFIIAKRVSTPIEKINESAKTLAKGDYGTFFSGGGYREIDELADTLNHTAKELSKVEKLRQELIANISHDLRTPLTLISGYAEAMCDLPGEMSEENAQIIVGETKRLTTLVNDVLDISKLQSGMQQINPARYGLTESIGNIVNRLNALLKKDGYTIEFLRDAEVTVYADESLISQAFYNLLINGINYVGSDKMVTVKQTLADTWVKIQVIDNGEGIEEEFLPHIWDRYFKVDKTHRRAVTGTGLGLSIVRSIIQLHGGEYGVFSKPREGSVFWFALQYEK
ncbi:sensor histidine kinase [Candidatus Contubernalis alkaliaceticus]|uniref:sensor histidine kinase n=1 Tax=Candidatus Contubernalis alkaliaceticus TaxID=338645 RepID=UPI001F4C4CEA|nr:HAMP domain-containing sensor histidine kinase [Candidatus Contubernalis alkalaceticus]UNC91046.1 HAMP domain-containing histidine kinase [Candidatus Contubernalis alkalaceticus]